MERLRVSLTTPLRTRRWTRVTAGARVPGRGQVAGDSVGQEGRPSKSRNPKFKIHFKRFCLGDCF